jgi:hypothetical protein
VIYGGDLNISYLRHVIEWPHATWWTKFRDECGLTDVIAKRPPPNVNLDDRVDYIYYHGPYEVSAASMPLGLPGSSDHSYVFTMLTRTDLPRDVLVPDLRTMLREQAVETVSRTDLLLAFTGAVNEPNTWVYSQSPHWLRSVGVGTTVTMELKTGVPAVKVPWVTEMTPQSAADELRSAGLKVRFTGGASAGGDPYVSGQNPRGDEIAFPGETVTCHLEGGPIP